MTSFRRSAPHAFFFAALLMGVLPAAYSKEDQYDACWKIHLDDVETGKVVEKGQGADIMMFQNPFHFVPPTQPGAAETFLFCTLRAGKPKDKPRSKGVLFLGRRPLPLDHIGNSSIGNGTRAYYGGWKSEAEPRGLLELSINFETLASRVIIVRGRLPNRVGMFGTGSAVPVSTTSSGSSAAE